MKPQTSGLVVGKLKRKILREPVGVALDGKIQGFAGNAVKNGATGRSDIEGKVTRVGASEPGGDRVSIKKGREIKLTVTEYALHRLFVRHPGRVLTHRHILREIWGPKSQEHRQYLRVYVTHLRQKIESDPASPSLIKTEPGIGYRFISNEAF